MEFTYFALSKGFSIYTFLKKRVWSTVGIRGRSNPPSTTMGFSFFVLSKGFSSYTCVAHHKIEDTDVPSLETITRTAKDLITSHYGWGLEADLDIRLYWPEEPLQSTESTPQLMTQLKNTVNDEYLEFYCRKVLTEDHLRDSGKNLKRDLIVVGAGVQVDFPIFVRAGTSTSLTHAGSGVVVGVPRMIVELVEKKVREIVRGSHSIKEPDISTLGVYEAWGTSMEDLVGRFTDGDNTWRTSARSLQKQHGTPRGDGCLFVELKTRGWNYLLCRKDGSQYTFIGPGVLNALPQEPSGVLMDSARRHIEKISNLDAATVSPNISMWGPSNESFAESLQDWKNVQLMAENFGKDLFDMVDLLELVQFAQPSVVLFTIENIKRPLETIHEEGHGMEREVITKLANKRESPSAGSKHSALRITQNESRKDAVYNSRPYNLTGPPVQIYHPAFATFIRENSRSIPVGELTEELKQATKLIHVSLEFFKEESDRKAKLNTLKTFGDLVSPEVNIEPRTIPPDGITTIFCPSAEQEATIRIVELKNDIGEGGSDPIMQAECGFALICSSDRYKPFRDASCCPMFLIGVVGPHLAVSGAVFAENLISQRLTDYIYLGPLPTARVGQSALSYGTHRVAQLLRALKISTQEVEDYNKGLEYATPGTSGPQGSARHQNPLPQLVPLNPIPSTVVPPHFLGYTVDNKTYKIHYTERLTKLFPYKAVFKGTVECEGEARRVVVIKFTYAYCKEAHELLAGISRAPSLRFCKHVHSVGMYVVVMDYVSGQHGGTPLEDKAHVEQLREALDTLHAGKYVYGDLRGPNVLIAADGPKLIDFDWCGEEGTARYPADINLGAEIGWHSEVCPGGLITKDHDMHMLGYLTGERNPPAT